MNEDNKNKGKEIIRDAPTPSKESYKTWEDLNSLLENSFHKKRHNHNQTIGINLHEYEIDKEEIIEVLNDKKYATKLSEREGQDSILLVSIKQ